MLVCLFSCLFVCLPASSLFARSGSFFEVFASMHEMLALPTNTHLPNCWPCQHRYCLHAPRRPPWLLCFGLCEHTHEMLALPTNRATPLSELLSTCSLPCAMQNHVRSPRQEVVSKWCCRDPLRETTGPASGKSKPSMTVLPLRA